MIDAVAAVLIVYLVCCAALYVWVLVAPDDDPEGEP